LCDYCASDSCLFRLCIIFSAADNATGFMDSSHFRLRLDIGAEMVRTPTSSPSKPNTGEDAPHSSGSRSVQVVHTPSARMRSSSLCVGSTNARIIRLVDPPESKGTVLPTTHRTLMERGGSALQTHRREGGEVVSSGIQKETLSSTLLESSFKIGGSNCCRRNSPLNSIPTRHA